MNLLFKTVDLNEITYPIGGGTVNHNGNNKFAYGAFRYKRPCSPSPHTSQFMVDALDSNGKTPATARARRSFKK